MWELVVAVVALSLFAAAAAALIYFWPTHPESFLDRTRKNAQIIDVVELSPDTKRFRVSTGGMDVVIGSAPGKHIYVFAPNPPSCLASGKWNGRVDPDKGQAEIARNYTPTTGNETKGCFDIIVKMYRPGKTRSIDGEEIVWKDGGKMTAHLDSKKPGDYIEILGPVGSIEYLGSGLFKLSDRTVHTRHVCMMAGGTGLTPMLRILMDSLRDKSDRTTNFTMIYANKTEDDILMKHTLDDAAATSKGRFKIYYTLERPPSKWKGDTGLITPAMIRERFASPASKPLILICGPPAMIETACKKNLEVLGYRKQDILQF